jgi:hypothetical protein
MVGSDADVTTNKILAPENQKGAKTTPFLKQVFLSG